MKNTVYTLMLLISIVMFGCGPNFNEVQMKKIEYDMKRVQAIEQIEVSKNNAKTQEVLSGNVNPDQGKYTNAGFLIETDNDGKIKTVYIGEGIINKTEKKAELNGLYAITAAEGYQPKESSIAKEVGQTVRDIGKYTLIGFGIDRVTGAMGSTTNTYTAGGDMATNSGTGTAGTTTTPVSDSYNDQSNQGNDLSDN